MHTHLCIRVSAYVVKGGVAHLLEAMGLLGISGSNGDSAEDAEAHARLPHCMVARGSADAKPRRDIRAGLPC